jgi:hypothetical protein
MGDPSTTCAAHCRSRPPLTLSERHFRRVRLANSWKRPGGSVTRGLELVEGKERTRPIPFFNTDLCTEKSSHGDFWPRNFVGSKTPGCPEAVRSERPPDDCDPRGGVGGRRSRAGCTRPDRHVSVLHDYHTEVSGSRPDQLAARSSRTQPIVSPRKTATAGANRRTVLGKRLAAAAREGRRAFAGRDQSSQLPGGGSGRRPGRCTRFMHQESALISRFRPWCGILEMCNWPAVVGMPA